MEDTDLPANPSAAVKVCQVDQPGAVHAEMTAAASTTDRDETADREFMLSLLRSSSDHRKRLLFCVSESLHRDEIEPVCGETPVPIPPIPTHQICTGIHRLP